MTTYTNIEIGSPSGNTHMTIKVIDEKDIPTCAINAGALSVDSIAHWYDSKSSTVYVTYLGEKRTDKKLASVIFSAYDAITTKDEMKIAALSFSDSMSLVVNHEVLARELMTLGYSLDAFATQTEEKEITLHIDCDMDIEALDRAEAHAESTRVVRLLGDMPSNVCTPEYLLSVAFDMECKEMHVTEFGEGTKYVNSTFGGVHAVGKGSDKDSKVFTMHYNCGDNTAPVITVIGKAVTFDSGGISLKPSNNMAAMKYDMCGGATAIGLMAYVIDAKLDINLKCMVGAAENMPSANALKPGDIISMLDGTSVEVDNTDAEGRLILADLLVLAGEYSTDVVIDMATLTGACLGALGDKRSGLFTNDLDLCGMIERAGESSLDKVWRLPVGDEYDSLNDSKFADIRNCGKGGAGASAAACFLKHFTKDLGYSWAHLDIAGTAFDKSATGRPMGLMIDLMHRFEAKHNSKINSTNDNIH